MPKFWQKIPRRYKELYAVAMAPFADDEVEAKYTNTTFKASPAAVCFLMNQGELNIPLLHKDGLIPVGGDVQVLKQYGNYKDFAGRQWAFIGQSHSGVPCGFVRCICEDGRIFEGIMNSRTVQNFCGNPHQSAKNGWGRYLTADGACMIGWWKHDQFHGNGRCYNPDGTIREEGWYEYGMRKEAFRDYSKECRYWVMKNEYFLSNGASWDESSLENFECALV